MTFSADAVANYFLMLADREERSLDPMKLQKLVYFAHGWHLALTGRPLLSEPIQAWSYGPVIYSIYSEFKKYGDQPITSRAQEIRVENDGVATYEPDIKMENQDLSWGKSVSKAIIERVWALYKDYTGIQLSNLTHTEGTPWLTIKNTFPDGKIPRGINIPNELIKKFFKQKMEQPSTA